MNKKPILTDKLYGALKWLALIVLPAVGTFIFAFADIWNLPYGSQIQGTLNIIATLIGAVIGVSAVQYKNANKKTNADE